MLALDPGKRRLGPRVNSSLRSRQGSVPRARLPRGERLNCTQSHGKAAAKRASGSGKWLGPSAGGEESLGGGLQPGGLC